MLAIKKWVAACAPVVSCCLTSVLLLTGCTPPGPRALLDGEALIKRGEYPKAVAKLQKATELLPNNAQAWNHLGLALHGAGQPAEAVRAYQQALTPGRNLAVAHYNLGCLYYEQGNYPGAADELRAYTVLQPQSLPAWRLLASAQLRSRQLDAAEKSYRYLLSLEPKSAEAWNAIGILQLHQRNKSRDAIQAFNYALQQQGDYAPALFNLALATHYYLNNRPAALQKYRQFLALNPHPENWQTAQDLANQLELELNPPPRPLPVAVAPPAVTNVVAPPAIPAPVRPAVTNVTRVEPPVKTNAVAAARPPVLPPPQPPAREPVVEVTQVPEPVPVRPAQDKPVVPKTATPRVTAPPAVPPVTVAQAEPAPVVTNKPGFFQKINPVNLFRRSPKPAAATNAITVAAAPAEPALPPGKPSVVTPLPGTVSTARYQYRSPARPPPGNRGAAEPEFKKGFMAHQRGELPEAMAAYRKALQQDPRYFEARHNLALAESDSGEVAGALADYELALAILPNSNVARYNFAQALRDANYVRDAVAELEKLLQEYPAETNGHLALANLYAQQLGQRALAREHYQKVLQLDPHHPKATDIRYWLAANP